MIEEFLKFVKSRNYSSLTHDSYKKDLNEFSDFLGTKNLKKVSENDIKSYFSFLHEKNNKVSTISRKISTLKSFYKYLFNINEIQENIMKKIKYPKKEKRLPKFMYYNELEKVIDISNDGKNGKRNNAILEILYATGVRVSELVNIKISDIDFERKTIRIMGKGSYERIVYFGDYALDAMNEYINTERKLLLKNKENEYLFLNRFADKISDRSIRNIIYDIIKRSCVKMSVSPHTLRHTFATHLINEGCDIRSVQELLGHKNLATTEIYTHITDEELRKVYLNSHPRSDEKNE